MSEVNPERGEVPILLGDRTFPMRPSYTAMQAIEKAHGPLLALTTRLGSPVHRLDIDEMSTIVTECIRAAGKDRGDAMLQAIQKPKIAELIFDQGIVSVVGSLEVLLINMITGGGKAKKKPDEKATAESTTES